MKVYHMDVWIKTNDPLYWRARILGLADSLNTEIDFSDLIEENEHKMPKP